VCKTNKQISLKSLWNQYTYNLMQISEWLKIHYTDPENTYDYYICDSLKHSIVYYCTGMYKITFSSIFVCTFFNKQFFLNSFCIFFFLFFFLFFFSRVLLLAYDVNKRNQDLFIKKLNKSLFSQIFLHNIELNVITNNVIF